MLLGECNSLRLGDFLLTGEESAVSVLVHDLEMPATGEPGRLILLPLTTLGAGLARLSELGLLTDHSDGRCRHDLGDTGSTGRRGGAAIDQDRRMTDETVNRLGTLASRTAGTRNSALELSHVVFP